MRLSVLILILVIIGNGLSFLAQAQQSAPVNIFQPKIPQTRKAKPATSKTESPSSMASQSTRSSRSTRRSSSSVSEDIPVAPEKISLNVEGVIWGTIAPKAIIDGDIYSEGDRVMIDAGKEAPISDAVIRKIDKLGVHVEYAGRMYTVDVVDKPNTKKKKKR
jgi:hypothetical protein